MSKTNAFQRYWPLISLILIAMLAASALTYGLQKTPLQWMHFFMGFFFCQFAMLKIFHPAQFAEGFQMYDLVAKKLPQWGLIYPLVELLLGLAYLSFFFPILTYVVTIIVMAVGAIGVIKTLKKGLDLRCACMGTVLDVPLSTVTLTEDIGMGMMALAMLIVSF